MFGIKIKLGQAFQANNIYLDQKRGTAMVAFSALGFNMKNIRKKTIFHLKYPINVLIIIFLTISKLNLLNFF